MVSPAGDPCVISRTDIDGLSYGMVRERTEEGFVVSQGRSSPVAALGTSHGVREPCNEVYMVVAGAYIDRARLMRLPELPEEYR